MPVDAAHFGTALAPSRQTTRRKREGVFLWTLLLLGLPVLILWWAVLLWAAYALTAFLIQVF